MMEEWKKIQSTYKIKEIIGIVCMTIVSVVGIIFECIVSGGKIFIVINNIESFALTVLQIQATVGTLIFTIITLMAGNISDSYMGVSISDFYLNIKPWYLTQKRLIIISLVLSLLSVFSFAFGKYNIIFCLFIASFIAIFISIGELYSAFEGRNKKDKEIEAYVEYMMENKAKDKAEIETEIEKKVNIYQNFILDWKNTVYGQDRESYEKFFNLFQKWTSILLNYREDKTLEIVTQQCYTMAYCLLGSEKTFIKEKGLKFVQEIYDTVWENISQNKPILNQFKSDFSLFIEIGDELIQNISKINVENVENMLKLENFVDSVLRVALWLRNDNLIDSQENASEPIGYQYNFQNTVSELCSFTRCIGHYLARQNSMGNIIRSKVWEQPFNRWSLFSTYGIPQERKEDFLGAKANVYFSYCFGLIVSGKESIVKEGLYFQGMRNLIMLDNKDQALLYLSVHCYIYYLAVREDDDCISPELRNSAKSIWNDENVKRVFSNFINKLFSNLDWINIEFLDEIYNIIKRFELFPTYTSSKVMIAEQVTSDFYLFLVLFLSHRYFCPELLEKNIDDIRAFRYVAFNSENETKKILNELYEMIFMENKNKQQINEEIQLMYNDLEKIVKKKQKERYIKEAKEAQKNYKSNINEQKLCEEMRKTSFNIITEKFAPILVDDVEGENITIELLELLDFTNSVENKSFIDSYYSAIDGNFLKGIRDYLCEKGVVERKHRFKDFANDKEFMEYLTTNNMHYLLGSAIILKNEDYKNNNEYKRFLEKYETMYTTLLPEGIALRKNAVQIQLHEIKASISSPKLEEQNIKYDSKTKEYQYSIINGLLIDFEEKELREFLHNNRKLIKITADVSIRVSENPCGTILDAEANLNRSNFA